MTEPSTVGFLCAGWSPDVGTVETSAEGLARALSAAGLSVAVLAVEREDARPCGVRDTKVDGVLVRRMRLPGVAPSRFEDLVRDPRAEAAVRDWLVAVRPDLVHVHHLASFGLGALDAIAHAGIPTVVSLHDYWTVCPRAGLMQPGGARCDKPRPRACAQCLEDTWPSLAIQEEQVSARSLMALEHLVRADRLIAPSRTVREVFARSGLDPARIQVLPTGLEVQTLLFETERARGEREHGYRLGVLGTVRPEKGVNDLAHAVCVAGLPGLTLEVHGPLVDDHGDATYRNALRRLADHDPRVSLHGPFPHRELARVLATLDAVALPSIWEEPSALTLREARAVGLPVLAAARGAALEHGRDAGVQLVEGEGVQVWTEALWTMRWERTAPVKGVTLLQAAEQVLRLYHGVWAERRARAEAAR